MFLENVTVLYLFDFLFKYSSLLLKSATYLVTNLGRSALIIITKLKAYIIHTI